MENRKDVRKEDPSEMPADNISGNETNEQLDVENSPMMECDSVNVASELAEVKDAYLRLMAEYDNYRKRTLKEKAELIKNGGEKVLVGLLPVLDDFERALKSTSKEMNVDTVVEGIGLIYNKFISFLKQNGVTEIEALNQPFNDEIFEAVAMIPAPDAGMKGKIVECVQTGYYLNDKVIRHPKVVVAE